eukprot:m.7516 g.7516  ORF g.7516 m.7516 type:complete len:176 (+) comp5043_c0_seq2:52-579(+)
MTSFRTFRADDLWNFNSVNLDPLTETYNLAFYFTYMARWPDLFSIAESASGTVMGYIMGKVEGQGKNWHGHVTALTVAPEHRRMGLANQFMAMLEGFSERDNCYFVDLFVRQSNAVAKQLYTKLGYVVYRVVEQYYSGANEEDALDMRKALSRDVKKESMVPLARPIKIHELDND